MNCQECNAEISNKMRFCTNCGTNLNASFGTDQNRRGQNDQPNFKTRSFKCNKPEFAGKIDTLQNWLTDQGFETQKFNADDGKTLIQAQKPGMWRKAVGMSTAANILLSQNKGKLIVEIGQGRWLDKAAGGLLARMLNPLFLLPAGYGALEQWQFPTKIFEFFSDSDSTNHEDDDEEEIIVE